MDHDLELIIPILEILEIEVCNILYNPGNIGKRIFSIQSYPGNSGSYDPYSLDEHVQHVKSSKAYADESKTSESVYSEAICGGEGGY